MAQFRSVHGRTLTTGDSEVSCIDANIGVVVWVTQADGCSCTVLTPDAARRLARQLLQAAEDHDETGGRV